MVDRERLVRPEDVAPPRVFGAWCGWCGCRGGHAAGCETTRPVKWWRRRRRLI